MGFPDLHNLFPLYNIYNLIERELKSEVERFSKKRFNTNLRKTRICFVPCKNFKSRITYFAMSLTKSCEALYVILTLISILCKKSSQLAIVGSACFHHHQVILFSELNSNESAKQGVLEKFQIKLY